MATLLCLPIAFGIMAGCGNKSGEVAQTTEKDSAARSFTALDKVEITDPYAVNAMALEREYLVQTLNEDKLLYWFYKNAGLTPKASSSYGGGWEGTLIGGHTLGHYLSALSQAYGNANTPASGENNKALFLERIEYVVDALAECQDNAVKAGAKAGFIWGAKTIGSNPEIQFDNVEKGLTNIATQAWVPWYTMHKILQGLIDAHTYTGSALALEVAKNLGDWVLDRVKNYSAAQQAKVLSTEYGGINDSLYTLYSITGEDKYVIAAHTFDEETLFAKIRGAQRNYLQGLHANTTIPKVIGALNRYILVNGKTVNGEKIDATDYLYTAEDFWDYVVEHHTYITGGNSNDEHFVADDALDAKRTNVNCETCNTYNMLKLSRMLFTVTGNKKYLDYFENTYYNAIWSSQNPETGMTMYFQPMATGYFKVYSTAESNFWCCTGSGMESFTKLNDSIYYDAGNAVYVSLYVASKYVSDSVSFTLEADLENSDSATIKVDSGSTILRLRKPDWTKSFGVSLNGKKVITTGEEAFVSVAVKKGDTVAVNMERTVQAFTLPDSENVYAFKYGPYVLSAELGTEQMETTGHGAGGSVKKPSAKIVETETIQITGKTLEGFISNINEHFIKGADNKFTLTGTDVSLIFSYHFRQYTQRYGLYFAFVGDDTALGETQERTEIDSIQPGRGQYEDGKLTDNGSTGGDGIGRYANAGGSFTYTLAVDKTKTNYLVLNLKKSDNGKSLRVQSNGVTLYEGKLNYSGSDNIYEVVIELPASVVSAATQSAADGEMKYRIGVTFSSGVSGEASAALVTFVGTVTIETKGRGRVYG